MLRHRLPIAAALVIAAACAKSPSDGLTPEPTVPDTVFVDRVVTRVDTVVDAETRQRLTQIEAEVLQRDAHIQVLTEQLEEAQREVVRTLARSQTVGTRAEAASAIAEAELAIRSLRAAAGRRPAPEVPQAEKQLLESNAAFEEGNWGGALYLASRARATAGLGTDRFRRAEGDDLRPGETQFQAPLRLQTTTRSNVRDGPGTNYRVLYTLEPQQPVTGLSYVEGWVRITDAEGRAGWIARSLVESRG